MRHAMMLRYAEMLRRLRLSRLMFVIAGIQSRHRTLWRGSIGTVMVCEYVREYVGICYQRNSCITPSLFSAAYATPHTVNNTIRAAAIFR